MHAPVLVLSDSWTDYATAWGTIFTAGAAFSALAVTIWLSVREHVHHRRDQLRQERVPQLVEIANQYARYLNASEHYMDSERLKAERNLEVQLALLPEGMGRKMKLKFSPESLTLKDRQGLPDKATPDRPSKQELVAELRDNIDSARRSGKPGTPWLRRVLSCSWWKG